MNVGLQDTPFVTHTHKEFKRDPKIPLEDQLRTIYNSQDQGPSMTVKTNTYQAIRAHVSGAYSTGTLQGKEYIVVPVVALVEGVIQGMAAEGPELALAEEFGRYPDSWNGRPIVMSHPTKDGKPISANSPEALEEYQIGFIFNAALVGSQLQHEAWVDIERMEALNDDSKEILEILQKGEMIEVSTGYFAQIEKTPGLHGNASYDAIQRNIVPDHLAFLANGTVGACSNKDGCGAQLAVNSKPSDNFQMVKTFVTPVACCDACAHGDHTHCEDNMPAANKDSKVDAKDPKKKQDPKAYAEVAATIANSIDGGITLDDARNAVCEAIKSVSGNGYTYVVAMTTDVVVYEQYYSYDGVYQKYQRSYSVDADGNVTLGEDVSKVRLVTKIIAVNADGTSPEENPEQNMTDQTTGAAAASTEVPADKKTTTQTVTNEQGTLEVTFNAEGKAEGFKLTPKVAPVAQTAKPATVAEFVAQAPAEMREIFESGIKMHEDKKNATIKALMDSGRCKFDEGFLKAQKLEILENMAELAAVPVSFAGRALPNANADTLENNAEKFTAAPLVFEAPKLVA